MKLSIKLFIILNVFILLILGWVGNLTMSIQLVISGLSIGLIGIPHGAIDHILFAQNTKRTKPFFFYSFYLGIIILVSTMWIMLPILGLILFLLLSAYHFGQSQFSRSYSLAKPMKILLYLSWGISVLSGLIVYNHEEIISIFSGNGDLKELLTVFQLPLQTSILILSTLTFLVVYVKNKKLISMEKFVMELMLFSLIHLSFYIQPLLLGFSIFFVTIHSLTVMKQEYDFLKSENTLFNFTSFLYLISPYTLLSITGLAILIWLSHFDFFPISKILLILMFISAFTVPHSFVMEQFYATLLKKSAPTEGE